MITVTDEAILVLLLMNGWCVWKKAAEIKLGGGKVEKAHLPRPMFTANAQHSRKYEGWNKDGKKWFNTICKKVEEQRNDKAKNDAFDKAFKEYMSKEKSSTTTKSSAPASAGYVTTYSGNGGSGEVVVFDDPEAKMRELTEQAGDTVTAM